MAFVRLPTVIVPAENVSVPLFAEEPALAPVEFLASHIEVTTAFTVPPLKSLVPVSVMVPLMAKPSAIAHVATGLTPSAPRK